MNKLFYAALAAVPAICVTSCSDPSESAAADVESLVDEVKACLKENEQEKPEVLIAALHECIVPRLESIASAVESMDSAEKFEFMKKYTLEENDTVNNLRKALKEEAKRRFDTKNEKRIWKKLPREAKVQLLEIGEAFAKVSVTTMCDAKVLTELRAWKDEKIKESVKRWEAEQKAMRQESRRDDYSY